MFESLITDRTGKDVYDFMRLREKGWNKMTTAEREQWSAGMKGAYNASDLNRVYSALGYLREILISAGYLSGREFFVKTDWAEGEVITYIDLREYLTAVEAVRNAMTQFETTPPTPANIGSLNYQDANDIEKILIDIHEIAKLMIASEYNYCGELYCGE